jgi:hypothetical protein
LKKKLELISKGDSVPEDYLLPSDLTQELNYSSSNVIMIAIVLLLILVALVGLAKVKNSIVSLGITIIAGCYVS